jgi:hypothetical protein
MLAMSPSNRGCSFVAFQLSVSNSVIQDPDTIVDVSRCLLLVMDPHQGYPRVFSAPDKIVMLSSMCRRMKYVCFRYRILYHLG